jgi:hypothetical protein
MVWLGRRFSSFIAWPAALPDIPGGAAFLRHAIVPVARGVGSARRCLQRASRSTLSALKKGSAGACTRGSIERMRAWVDIAPGLGYTPNRGRSAR